MCEELSPPLPSTHKRGNTLERCSPKIHSFEPPALASASLPAHLMDVFHQLTCSTVFARVILRLHPLNTRHSGKLGSFLFA